MISKRDLYVKIGKLMPYEDLLADIEKTVIAAAEARESSCIYMFNDKVDDYMIINSYPPIYEAVCSK